MQVRPFTFLEFRFPNAPQACGELFFVEGDRFRDFIRRPLPAGPLAVYLVNEKGIDFYTLLNTEFTQVGGLITLDFAMPAPGKGQLRLYFSLRVAGVELLRSDTFLLRRTLPGPENPSRRVRFAFNEAPNDYVEIRLPVGLDFAKPKDNGSQFLTSDDELVRPIAKTQVEYELYCNFRDYHLFQEKLYNALRQRYFRIQFGEEGFFKQVIFEDDFELEYFKRKGKPGNREANLLAKVKLNDTGISEQDNVEGLTLFPQPYAFAEVNLLTENLPGDSEFSYDILLDRPLPEAQTVSYVVVGIGPNPAQATDFQGGVFPGGNLVFAPGEMNKFLDIILVDEASLQDGVNFQIVWTDSPLIRFPGAGQAGAIIQLTGTLDFGAVPPGLFKKLTFQIVNVGSQPLLVTALNTPTGFYILSWYGGAIAPGQSQPVEVVFEPAAEVSYSGIITVISNAVSGGNAIAVSGSGQAFNTMKFVQENISLLAYTPQVITHNLDASVVVVEVWDSATGERVAGIEITEDNTNSLTIESAVDIVVDVIILG